MGDEFPNGKVDLFGWPIMAPRGPGRPPHVPTAETRAFANMMFVCGHSPMDVARLFGLKKTAFYEHYREEIRERAFAALKMKGRQMMRLNEQAEAGNVAAEKALAGMIQSERVNATADRVKDRGRPPGAETKVPTLGKKEAQTKAAKALGGNFATRRPPELLMN